MTTYFISKTGNDSNTGTESSPFLSIQKGVDVAVPGDNIIIESGLYNEQVTINNKSYLTLQAINSKLVIIDGIGIGTDLSFSDRQWGNGLVNIKNSSNIYCSGLKIQNSLLCGIAIESSNMVTIDNTFTDNTYSSGIQAHFSEMIKVHGNECKHASNSETLIVQENISFHEVLGFEISNNFIHDGGHPILGGGEGIIVKAGCNDGTIHNNIVNNVNSIGIYVDGWDKITSNIKIYENLCINTGWSGIAVSGEIGGTASNIEISNNICRDCDAGIALPAFNNNITPGHLTNINIYNNTLYNNIKGIQIGYYPLTIIDYLIITNNIISKSSMVNIIWNNRDRDTNVIITDNYYDILIPYIDSYEGTKYISKGDPLFVDPENNNFHLQTNSPAKIYGAYPILPETTALSVPFFLALALASGIVYAISKRRKHDRKRYSSPTIPATKS